MRQGSKNNISKGKQAPGLLRIVCLEREVLRKRSRESTPDAIGIKFERDANLEKVSKEQLKCMCDCVRGRNSAPVNTSARVLLAVSTRSPKRTQSQHTHTLQVG